MTAPVKSRKIGVSRTTGDDFFRSEKILRPRSLTSECNLPIPNEQAFGRSEKKKNKESYQTPNTPIKRSPTEDKTLLSIAQNEILKKYSHIEPLAETKTSTVYKAIDSKTQKKCVIKQLQNTHLKSTQAQKSALLEYKNAKKLRNHPNLVNYLDSIHYGPWIYFQMEYCELGSLEDFLRGNVLRDNINNVESDGFWFLALDILMGLSYMHSKGFAHLDIKPANIFLVPKPNSAVPSAKIGDFGLSVKIGSLHQKKIKKGDGRYLAPELLNKNQPIADKADIYALGITFYEMASLYEASSALWEELQKLNGQIEYSYFSSNLNQLLRRMLTLDPELRGSAVSLVLFSDKFRTISAATGMSITVFEDFQDKITENLEDSDEEGVETQNFITEDAKSPFKVSPLNFHQDSVRKKLLFQ